MKNFKEIYHLNKKIIEINSIESKPAEILKVLDLFKKEFSKDFFIFEFHFKNRPMIVLSNTKSRKVDFILAGHVDVVPGPNELFVLKEDNDKFLGRGVYDMKTALIMSIFALKKAVKKNSDLQFAIFVTTDEEKDGLSTKYLIDEIGYQAKFAIFPDGGSEHELIIAQKGFLQIKLDIIGKSAHASTPFDGENPIHLMNILYNRLLKFFPLPKNREDWKTSICVTKINTDNESINQTPKSLKVWIDIRYVDFSHVEEIKKIIIETISNVKLEIIAENAALDVSPENYYIKLLSDIMEKYNKKKVLMSKTCGTSDAVFLAEKNIPAVLFRPEGGGMHQDEEWVSKSSLENFWYIIYEFLKNF